MKNSFVVINVPHASTNIPKSETHYFNRKYLSHEITVMTDHYCDDLFDMGFEMNISPVSRLVCDMERFRNDEEEVMSKCGMGAIYTMTSDGKKLREMSKNHKQYLLTKYYDPYHKRFSQLVSEKLNKFGKCLIIDGHSFYPIPLPYELDQNEVRSDICIGTDSFHTPSGLTELLKCAFEKRGYSVSVNAPFSGTIVPMEYYRKDLRVQSVMIELNRRLYINDFAGKTNDYSNLKRDIRDVVEEVMNN